MAKRMSLEEAQGLLTEEEIAALREQAKSEVLAERKKLAEAAVLAELKAQERAELGVMTGDEAKDQIVWIFIDLPEYANHILLDGRAFFHGQDYPVPSHQAAYLMEMSQRAHDHQNEVDGKGTMSLRKNKTGIIERNAGTALSMKTRAVSRAPARTH